MTDIRELQAELERSRETSYRLLDSLAEKIGARHAARYVHEHSVKEIAADAGQAVRKNPARTILIMVLAGVFAGCVVRAWRSGR